MVLQCGDKLEVIIGVSSKATCSIKDRGLSGLQRIFNSQDGNSSNFPDDHNWGRQFAKLTSPHFWEPISSNNHWAKMRDNAEHSSLSSREKNHTQGELKWDERLDQSFSMPKMDQRTQERSKGVQRRLVKVVGRCATQVVKEKVEFMLM